MNEKPISLEVQRLRDEARAALAAIVESSDDAIVSKTLDGIIRTWNAGAERIFGYTPDEVIGQPVTMLMPVERRDEEPRILAQLCRGERVDHFETVRMRKDGRLIDVSVTISPVRDSTGRIIGASKIARDITAQKQVQRELKAAKEAAEAATRAKDQFLGVLSHELRTPLTPVLASLSFLETRADLPDELRSELSMMRRNIETQARLVDDLLDLTRISRGKIELHFEALDLHDAVDSAMRMVRADATARSIRLSAALEAAEHYVWADAGRFQQVLLNLLSNALKFTPPGGQVSIRTTTPAAGRVRVSVTDTGVGMEAELLPRLFNAFEQGERTTTRQFGGLGLGLAICRSLVEMHGGRIWASSAGKGRGATFVVELAGIEVPVVSGEPATPPDGALEPVAPTRILLVEDHADTRHAMTRLLNNSGCAVVAASTVAEALRLARGQRFDLLISDIGLPDGSGEDVMRGLRAGGDDRVRGIALSGFGQPDDLRRSKEAGFELHLTKPINFQSLREVLRRMVGAAPAVGSG